MKRVLVLHGPNMNMLGIREPALYGNMSLDDLDERLRKHGKVLGAEVTSTQSNHEGALIDALQEAAQWAEGVVFNPAGYTHTSVALRDAVASLPIPVVEVHMSNISAREEFRQRSLITPVAAGHISGLGWRSYLLGLQAVVELSDKEEVDR